MFCESSFYSCAPFENLCSTFGFDNLHVHLKPLSKVILLDVWVDKLTYCGDPKAVRVIVGLKNGFKVGYTGGNLISASQNMPSAENVDTILLSLSSYGQFFVSDPKGS